MATGQLFIEIGFDDVVALLGLVQVQGGLDELSQLGQAFGGRPQWLDDDRVQHSRVWAFVLPIKWRKRRRANFWTDYRDTTAIQSRWCFNVSSFHVSGWDCDRVGTRGKRIEVDCVPNKTNVCKAKLPFSSARFNQRNLTVQS